MARLFLFTSVVLDVGTDAIDGLVQEVGVVEAHPDGVLGADGGAPAAGAAVRADDSALVDEGDCLDVAGLCAGAASLALVGDLDGHAFQRREERLDLVERHVAYVTGDTAALAAEAGGQHPPVVLDAEERVVDARLADDGHQSRVHGLAGERLGFLDAHLPLFLRLALDRGVSHEQAAYLHGVVLAAVGEPATAVVVDDPVGRLFYQAVEDRERHRRVLGHLYVLVDRQPAHVGLVRTEPGVMRHAGQPRQLESRADRIERSPHGLRVLRLVDPVSHLSSCASLFVFTATLRELRAPPLEPHAYLLLKTLVARVVILAPLQLLGQVLLLDDVALELVGVLVTLPVAYVFHQPRGSVADMERDRKGAVLADIGLDLSVASVERVALGGSGEIADRLGECQVALGHADEVARLHGGHTEGKRPRVGVAHVLGRETDQPADYVERVLAGLEHPPQPVEAAVGVRIAQGLVERADKVEVLLALLVVEDGLLLCDLQYGLHGDVVLVEFPGHERGEFEQVQCDPRVAVGDAYHGVDRGGVHLQAEQPEPALPV